MLVPTGKDERIEYDERVDIWCLGILLYNFLFGKTPFMTEPFDKEKTKKLIK
jgi:serine/threonine protein kinase